MSSTPPTFAGNYLSVEEMASLANTKCALCGATYQDGDRKFIMQTAWVMGPHSHSHSHPMEVEVPCGPACRDCSDRAERCGFTKVFADMKGLCAALSESEAVKSAWEKCRCSNTPMNVVDRVVGNDIKSSILRLSLIHI